MNQLNGNLLQTNQNKLNSMTVKMLNECSSSKIQELEDKILFRDFIVNEVKTYIIIY